MLRTLRLMTGPHSEWRCPTRRVRSQWIAFWCRTDLYSTDLGKVDLSLPPVLFRLATCQRLLATCKGPKVYKGPKVGTSGGRPSFHYGPPLGSGVTLRSGFTLVELLVVMAILSLLAAILFPVFAHVRENARRAACLSNLRQVTLGLLQYSQDCDDRCPRYTDDAGAASNYWPQFIAPYVQPQATADFNGASKIFVCPSAPYDAAAISAHGRSSVPSYGLSDNWVDYICPDDCPSSTEVAHAFSEASDPAGTVLLAETMYSTNAARPGYALATPPIDGGDSGFIYNTCGPDQPAFSPGRMLLTLSWRHSGSKDAWCADPPTGARVNVAYADGHVKSETTTQLLNFRQWSLRQGAGDSGCHPDANGQKGCWYP